MDIEAVKQQFGIIGHDEALNNAIHIAVQVAPTDLSVLITGESGAGKENFSKIIHAYSAYRHRQLVAVNCGAIPEGTIDSELFGHKKGSFTGAIESRKGYFETANGSTIFLDEIAELPLATQAKLLRVLENGEFICVGDSLPQKTHVRVVAATNVNLQDMVAAGKFRADLYWRLCNVQIRVPALRDRKNDIPLLFIKFAADFAEKNHATSLTLNDDAVELLKSYRWPGNVRELKSITQQMSILETDRQISAKTLSKYLENNGLSNLPVFIGNNSESSDKNEHFERELIFHFLGDMKKEVSELKSMVNGLVAERQAEKGHKTITISDIGTQPAIDVEYQEQNQTLVQPEHEHTSGFEPQHIAKETSEPSFSIENSEKDLIKKCLEKYNYNRKLAAIELGISERTLYRRIKDYGL
ncbi:MAG: sigma-54-dependent Fis family transcriptional regulator [Bacteroidales bacterium]|nr:sigma-54-dependent Fis family transcriptional regulator [Bacteroidales bacterium]